MIFVTIGGKSTYGFLRLVKKMDEIAPELHEEVIMQIGDTRYVPQNVSYFTYVTFEESIRLFSEAKLVVSHCSTGTILNAKKYRVDRPTIVIPSRKMFDEIVDDHQMELASVIEKKIGHMPIFVVYDTDLIKDRIVELLSSDYVRATSREESFPPVLNYLKEYINGLQQDRSRREGIKTAD